MINNWIDWLGAAAIISSFINFWMVIKHTKKARLGQLANKSEAWEYNLSNWISNTLVIVWAMINILRKWY